MEQHENDQDQQLEVLGPVKPTGGIYSAPVIGGYASGVREFFDGMAPTENDSAPVVVAKEVLRWGTVLGAGIGAAALTAVVVL